MSKIFIYIATVAAITLGAASAGAEPAPTESITLSLAGKTPAMIHTEIQHAAQLVCDRALAGSIASFYGMEDCVAKAIRDAETLLKDREALLARDKLASTQ